MSQADLCRQQDSAISESCARLCTTLLLFTTLLGPGGALLGAGMMASEGVPFPLSAKRKMAEGFALTPAANLPGTLLQARWSGSAGTRTSQQTQHTELCKEHPHLLFTPAESQAHGFGTNIMTGLMLAFNLARPQKATCISAHRTSVTF